METIGVILAGGRSSRMGRDKSGLPWEGATFAARLAQRYGPLVDRLYVSVGAAGKLTLPGVEELPDLRPGEGPLAGLEAAFLRTGAERVFLTAVDLPFGEPALARLLLEELGERDACLIRRRTGQPEPLFAAYRNSCLPRLQACLDGGRRAVRALLEGVDCRFLEEEELPGFDLERVLLNVNTPEDYRRAEKILNSSLQ